MIMSDWWERNFKVGQKVRVKEHGNTGVITWLGYYETWDKNAKYVEFLGYQVPSKITRAANVRLNGDGELPANDPDSRGILIGQHEIELILVQKRKRGENTMKCIDCKKICPYRDSIFLHGECVFVSSEKSVDK